MGFINNKFSRWYRNNINEFLLSQCLFLTCFCPSHSVVYAHLCNANLLKMIELTSGIITAVAIIVIAQAFSKVFTIKLFAATNLVAIAFIYIGFSLKGNPVSSIALEVGVALIFYFMALIGYIRDGSLIAYGIILHGLWDVFHHNSLFVNIDIPTYWPSFCFIIDIIDGLFFLYIFKSKRSKQISKPYTESVPTSTTLPGSK